MSAAVQCGGLGHLLCSYLLRSVISLGTSRCQLTFVSFTFQPPNRPQTYSCSYVATLLNAAKNTVTMSQSCLRRFRQSLFFLTMVFCYLRSYHFGPRFLFAILLDCAVCANIVCVDGLPCCCSQECCRSSGLAAVEAGISHFKKNSLEGVKTHQAPFHLFIVCRFGVV